MGIGSRPRELSASTRSTTALESMNERRFGIRCADSEPLKLLASRQNYVGHSRSECRSDSQSKSATLLSVSSRILTPHTSRARGRSDVAGGHRSRNRRNRNRTSGYGRAATTRRRVGGSRAPTAAASRTGEYRAHKRREHQLSHEHNFIPPPEQRGGRVIPPTPKTCHPPRRQGVALR